MAMAIGACCVFFYRLSVYPTRMGAITDLIMSSPDGEGQALSQALRRRDPDALDRLIAQYHYRLLRYLLSLTRCREIAEDIFQETWIRVLERGHQYNGRSRFDTWLFAIARHLVIDRLRREHPKVSLEALLESDGEPQPAGLEASAADTALDLVYRKEEEDYVAGALATLPATQREALVLRFQEDLSLEEIAQVSAAPLSTVKARIYRGLDALREALPREKV